MAACHEYIRTESVRRKGVGGSTVSSVSSMTTNAMREAHDKNGGVGLAGWDGRVKV